MTKGVNSTFIALIPKVDSPQRLADFLPISLVGCMYKVLAKVLADRLRSVMGFVESNSQSAFVRGKQILDGILIANEVVDEARRMNNELLLFKVDFEKAYDSVDLNYLNSVMVNMNFSNSLAEVDNRMCSNGYCIGPCERVSNGGVPYREGAKTRGSSLFVFIFIGG